MEIIIAILSALLIITGFAIRNLIKKNEELEDFIVKQSEAIDQCDRDWADNIAIIISISL